MRGTTPYGRAIAGRVSFRLLPYRVHVRFEDDSLEPEMAAMAVSARQPREAAGEMHYVVEGSGPYAVLEEGARQAAGLSTTEVAGALAARCRARVLDHLSLGGWTAASGAIVHADGRRVLVLGDDSGAVVDRLRTTGEFVEGDDLVFFRAGAAVCLPQPSSVDIVEGPVSAVAVVAPATDGPYQALTTGDVVEALVTATLPSWTPPANVLRACLDLVRGADGYQVSGGT